MTFEPGTEAASKNLMQLFREESECGTQREYRDAEQRNFRESIPYA